MPDSATWAAQRARIEGYATGVRETLDTLERSGCLTTSHARRFVARLRRQMTTSPASDMVRPPMTTTEQAQRFADGLELAAPEHGGYLPEVILEALGNAHLELAEQHAARRPPVDLSGRPLDPVDPITGQ